MAFVAQGEQFRLKADLKAYFNVCLFFIKEVNS